MSCVTTRISVVLVPEPSVKPHVGTTTSEKASLTRNVRCSQCIATGRRDNRMESLVAADEPAVEPEAFTDSLQRVLMAAIGELPAEQRDALLLQEQGFSLEDIAQITGAPTETVKSRLRYARRQLREQLGEEL